MNTRMYGTVSNHTLYSFPDKQKPPHKVRGRFFSCDFTGKEGLLRKRGL